MAASMRPARRPITGWAKRPLFIALAVLAVYVALTVVQLGARHWDVTSFITAGDTFVHREQLTAPIAILPNSPGYDGEFYYRLALDPFTTRQTAFGITLDNPSTRMARIGFPLLAWAASLGQVGLLPWAMVGLNLAGLSAIAWISAAIARANGLPAWLGLAPAFYPGFILTLVRDTTEIAATTFALAGLAFALRRQFWRAAPFAAFAVMTRETTLFYLAGFGLVELTRAIRERRWSWGIVALALPAVVFVAWQWTIIRIWSASSYTGTEQNIGLPFEGMGAFFTKNIGQLLADPLMRYPFKLHLYYAAAGGMCVAVCGLAGIGALGGRVNPGLKLSWLLYVALIICLTTAIWIEPYDFLRAFTDCFVIGATLVMLTGMRRLWVSLMAMILAIWLLTAWFISH